VPGKLRKLYLEDGYVALCPLRVLEAKTCRSFRVVVISNQGGISLKPDTKAPKSQQTKHAAFKSKVSAVFGLLDIPISIYAATEKDIFRKPRTGMWKELLEDYDIHLPGDLDLEQSIFVGDAGGRQVGGGKPKDFSCSDRYGATLSPSFYSDF
jgi:bifunctional polynucleotide phosphatase/kinase